MIVNLRVLRESKGWTQKQLADKIFVTQQTLQKYESQKIEPDIKTLKMLAAIFNVSVDYLVGYTSPGDDPNYCISSEEFRLIELYRSMDPVTRHQISGIIKKLSGQ